MAGQGGGASPDIKTTLLTDGARFSFFQALRLLDYVHRRQGTDGKQADDLNRRIRVRPELSLTFPGTDITAIVQDDTQPSCFVVTATFFGLYGASSPLPAFYTEDLLQERNDGRSITRDFLDIVNMPLYRLLFKLWGKYRLLYQLAEAPGRRTLQRLYCFLGLESGAFRRQLENPYRMLRYAGIASQSPRSAEGLRAMLSDALETADVRILACVERMAPVPEEQRLRLDQSGNCLGENSVLGEQVPDRMGKFRIQIGPAAGSRLHRLLPDGELFAYMAELIRFYLDQPLDWDLEIVLETGEGEGVVLGQPQWSSLGWNTWLIAEPPQDRSLSVLLEPLPAL